MNFKRRIVEHLCLCLEDPSEEWDNLIGAHHILAWDGRTIYYDCLENNKRNILITQNSKFLLSPITLKFNYFDRRKLKKSILKVKNNILEKNLGLQASHEELEKLLKEVN